MNLDIIKLFDAATLLELDEKNLLSNRRDVKYVFPFRMLSEVLADCISEYSILEIDGHRTFNYQTTYYDTADLRMYHEHQRGKLERTKIRVRKYLESSRSFVELKIKSNKNKTIKRRIEGEEINIAAGLIQENSNYLVEELIKIVAISYKRITLLHKFRNEKLTIDFDLEMKNGEAIVRFPELCFAEVKTIATQRTDFCTLMKSFGVREASISKYCLGVASLYPGVKKNNFKLSLARITKTQANEAA